VAAAGCSTSASIEREDGPRVRGEILGGSPDSIIVNTETGGVQLVSRGKISNISHPGNVATTVGLGLVVVGIFSLIMQGPACDEAGRPSCVVVALPFGMGGAVFLSGAFSTLSSMHAADDESMVTAVEKLKARRAFAPPAEAVPPKKAPADD
jgi:hypothetical protein